MRIDRRKLEEAIIKLGPFVGDKHCMDGFAEIVEAAKAHLSTLSPEPRKPTLAHIAEVLSYEPANCCAWPVMHRAAAETLRRLDEFRKHALSKDNEGYYCNVRCFEFLRSLP